MAFLQGVPAVNFTGTISVPQHPLPFVRLALAPKISGESQFCENVSQEPRFKWYAKYRGQSGLAKTVERFGGLAVEKFKSDEARVTNGSSARTWKQNPERLFSASSVIELYYDEDEVDTEILNLFTHYIDDENEGGCVAMILAQALERNPELFLKIAKHLKFSIKDVRKMIGDFDAGRIAYTHMHIGSFKDIKKPTQVAGAIASLMTGLKTIDCGSETLSNGMIKALKQLSSEEIILLHSTCEEILKTMSVDLVTYKDQCIEDFIMQMEKSNWVFPLSVDEVRYRLSSLTIKVNGLGERRGTYNASRHSIELDLHLFFPNVQKELIRKVLFHEFLHALSGPTRLHDGERLARGGLRIHSRELAHHVKMMFPLSEADWSVINSYDANPLEYMSNEEMESSFNKLLDRIDSNEVESQGDATDPMNLDFLGWLDEALTEYLAIQLSQASVDKQSYRAERRQLQKLLNAGIPMQLFIDAYFEQIYVSEPDLQLTALSTLFSAISEKVSDGWLFLDAAWHDDEEKFTELSRGEMLRR